MRNIKSFEIFLEDLNSKIGKVNFSNRRNDSIISKINLYKLADRIYAVAIEDPNLRTLLFMRYAEFYETPNDNFRDKQVNVNDYIKWYKEERRADLFTYQYDWSGFNIPSPSIKKCISTITDPNDYDEVMRNIIDIIDKDSGGVDSYLLGVDTISGKDTYLLEHELAHGLYYTNKVYKSEMDKLTDSLPKNIFDGLKSIILDIGYTDFVVNDEIQAYVSTGLYRTMENIDGISEWKDKYRSVLDNHLKIDIRPIKLEFKISK